MCTAPFDSGEDVSGQTDMHRNIFENGLRNIAPTFHTTSSLNPQKRMRTIPGCEERTVYIIRTDLYDWICIRDGGNAMEPLDQDAHLNPL